MFEFCSTARSPKNVGAPQIRSLQGRRCAEAGCVSASRGSSVRAKKRDKKGLFIALAVIVVVAFVIVAASTGLFGSLFGSKHSTVRVGYSRYPYPPLHYKDGNGDLVGFDVDLARAAGEIMGSEIEFVPIDWSERADALLDGDVDILWGGLERATLDESVIKFTRSYLRSNIILLMNRDRDYAEFADLQGLNVCALNFTPAFYYLQVYNRDVIKSQRSYTPPEYEALLGSMSSGEFDCMITDTSFASFYIKATGVDYKLSETVLGSNYAAAVRSKDTKLFDRLQGALDRLEEDGTIAALRGKWIEK